MRRATHAAILVGIVASLSLFPAPGWAQSDDERASARAAATAGAQALEQGRYDEAIDLFRRAEGIIHAPPHLLYIARAQAKLGRLVSAHETYVKIARETIAPDAPRAFTDAVASATDEDAALMARIPTITIDVEGAAAEEVTLVIDGAPVPSAMIGLARPIDPGKHELVAKTEHGSSRPSTVNVLEGSKGHVKLVVEAQAAAASGGPAPPETTKEPAPRGRPLAPALVALGVGVVGVAAGTIFMLQNRGKRDDADALCPSGCPLSRRSEIEALDDDASRAATLSWIGYGVGVAGIGTAAVLYLLAREPAAKGREGLRARPYVGLGAAGLGGTF